ncbi:prepilin-type N-terminal cleavage/methylation domain-containing protein [Clostridium celatum]|uniref:Prepilin-type cleavage/methylation protein n=1 Tax=Clostridium celatum DSM 1785 TaxID=545697 RepID=L1QGB7_9CLOT|nr:prepilin-type N-terminal cleavage/methylation domain-containing protein [Clostridium celatum]EKY26981.1 prepilin-type cleavage/methylation protein [Clostridium celatum DSM 1785]MCE9654759.1 prepilin-type N-terminal cleavage/methylation domain-containing protein [Clostridium celatum]MDU3722970.1 competence type IV pilus minor pilin ComGF [Clostridium celatum]MDU6295802.1 competence type IV pilus minor pilin ComGF [Clostridium celatum]MDY3359283.1 competence type IV pilus minor pilin ComGF [C
MSRYKRGYTLLEFVAVMSMFLIIGAIVINLGIFSVKDYLNKVDKGVMLEKFDNAMLNIDIICNKASIVSIDGNVTAALGKGNNIVIQYIENNEEIKKTIYLNGNRLMVNTVVIKNGYNVDEGNNVILSNVENFEVNKKGKLIYYTIEIKNSGERIRCI